MRLPLPTVGRLDSLGFTMGACPETAASLPFAPLRANPPPSKEWQYPPGLGAACLSQEPAAAFRAAAG